METLGRDRKIQQKAFSPKYLVTLLVRVAPVAVREVDVTIGLCHHPPDGVAPLAYDVGVVGVGHVHLHGHSAGNKTLREDFK